MSAPFYLAPPPAATLIGRGDIYEFVPIPWLNPPVHVLRNWQQGAAEVQQASRVKDAFRVGSRDNAVICKRICQPRQTGDETMSETATATISTPDPSPAAMAVYRATAQRRAAEAARALASRRARAQEVARQAAMLLKEQFGATQVVV